MNRFEQRIASVVNVGDTADAARLGRWMLAFQGVVTASAGWWIENDRVPPWVTLLLGAVVLLVSVASARLPWPTARPSRLAAYPVIGFVTLAALGLMAAEASAAFVGMITLWFVFIGLVMPVHSGLRLLVPGILTWVVMQGELGREQVVRLMLATVIWVILSDALALRAMASRALTEDLTQQAGTDPLTQLPNRRALEAALARLTAGDVLVVIDLDHFKDLNDRSGHAYGDSVLVEFAGTLSGAVRGTDLVARFGGEEFVIVLPQSSHHGRGAAAVVARLRGRWSQLHPEITWSAGASCHVEGTDPHHTLREADRALYRAKATGRDRVVVSGDARELVGIATADELTASAG